MKWIICALLVGVSMVGTAWADGVTPMGTEYRLRLRKRGDIAVDYAAFRVNGIAAWTTAERDALIARFTPFISTAGAVSVITVTPAQYEINVTTTPFTNFESEEGFLDAFTRKGAEGLIEELQARLGAKNFVGGQATQRADLQQRLDYLGHAARNLLP